MRGFPGLAVALSLSLAGTPASAAGGEIVRVAGGGAGDGKLATEVPIFASEILVLQNGDLLFGDGLQLPSRLRRLSIKDGRIGTFAGSDVSARDGASTLAEIGDGGPASAARFVDPRSPILDASGNVYVSDQYRIRKIHAQTGAISTIAGTGERGFSGDGGLARQATFGELAGLALDKAGNLYVADPANKRVRRIDQATGRISTYAGNGAEEASGDGGPARSAGLGPAFFLAFDAADNLYVSSSGYTNIIRRIAPNGIISTVAGTGEAGFSGDGGRATTARLNKPHGLLIDEDGSLLIADTGNGRIRRVDLHTGIITTIAGTGGAGFLGDGGPAARASFDGSLYSMARAPGGALYVANGEYIRRIDRLTGITSTIAGNGSCCWSGDDGSALNAMMMPWDVATDGRGNLYIADFGNSRIRKVDAHGALTTIAGNGSNRLKGEGGSALQASIGRPTSIAIDHAGNIFFVTHDLGPSRLRQPLPLGQDTRRNLVMKIDVRTGILSTFAGDGYWDGLTCGRYNGDGIPATLASLACPSDLALDALGNLYIADAGNGRIRRVDAATGLIHTVAGGGLLEDIDGVPATAASLRNPTGVAIDADGNLYIANSGRCRIQKVDAVTGIIRTVAGTAGCGHDDGGGQGDGDGGPATAATFMSLEDVEVAPDGTVFVADRSSNRLRRFTPGGTIDHVAGGWNPDDRYSAAGDGGPASQAGLRFPRAIHLDAKTGDLFVVDEVNRRVRAISL